jgi:hypothetical protein
MAKRGPKGAWKVKGKTRDELFMIFEENASVASTKIPDALFERTGVRVSSSRIRDFRAIWKKGSSMRLTPMVVHSKRALAGRSSSP